MLVGYIIGYMKICFHIFLNFKNMLLTFENKVITRA
jgi:hypothetical protein